MIPVPLACRNCDFIFKFYHSFPEFLKPALEKKQGDNCLLYKDMSYKMSLK